MDERTKELIAIGASAAVNCRPCLEYHWREGQRLGIPRQEALVATQVGLMVNRGAASKTKGYVAELIGGQTGDGQTAEQDGCGCGA